jgi:hypothetical protein
MTDYRIEMGRRAAACKHWRWIPGMKWQLADQPDVRGRTSGETHYRSLPPNCLPPFGAVPDLRDPATVGCLRWILSEVDPSAIVWATPALCMSDDPDQMPTVAHPERWFVWQADEVNNQDDVGYGRSEVEALVNALERAG